MSASGERVSAFASGNDNECGRTESTESAAPSSESRQWEYIRATLQSSGRRRR